MHFAAEGALLVLGHFALDSIYLGRDVASAESMSEDGEVLTAGHVARVGAHLKDDRYVLGLIACRVVKAAHSGVMVADHSETGLPHHRDLVSVGNRQLANLTSGMVLAIMAVRGLMVNVELEVDEGTFNTSIDERHLVRRETTDEIHG